MTDLLRDVLRQHADATPAPPVDLDAVLYAGDRRVRRGRLATGLAAAAVTALVAGSGLVVQGLLSDPAVGPAAASDRFAERRVSWATGDVIHWGSDSFPVGRRVVSYVQTDEGFVFTTPARDVWFHDGTVAARIGHAGAGRLRADDEGSLVAWVGADEAGAPEYVVYDTGVGRVVARVADDAAGPAMSETDLAAEVFAVDDGAVYWRVDGDRLVRYEVASQETTVVHDQDPPADPAHKGPAVYELADAAAGRLAFLVDAGRGTEAKVARTVDLDAATVARASQVLLSPDASFLAADEDDRVTVYDVASRTEVTPDLARYAYAVVHGWVDADTAMAYALEDLQGPGYDVDLLSCELPSGSCAVVGEAHLTGAEGQLVVPTGDPMDT